MKRAFIYSAIPAFLSVLIIVTAFDYNDDNTLSGPDPGGKFLTSSSGQVEIANIYTKGKAIYPWGCPDSLGIQLIKYAAGFLPINLNIKIINEDAPFATKVDTTIFINVNNAFDTLLYYVLPCIDKKKANLTDVVVVEALPGDTAYPIGNDTTKLKKEYCIKYSLDEMNYADGCRPNDTTFGIPNGIFVSSFTNNGPASLPVKSVEHVFRDTAGAPGKQYKIVIYSDTTSGLPGNLLYASANLTSPTGTGADQRIEHSVTSNVNISANRKFFVGIRQLTSGSIKASAQRESPVRAAGFYSSTNAGATWSDFRNSSYNVRLDIEPQTNPRAYIRLINEGFYNAATNISVPDTFRVYARGSTSPYAVADSSKAVIDGIDFDAIFEFNTLARGTNYYLQVKHRNHIQTWSSSPAPVRRIDFTGNISSAYGNNMVLVDTSPARYGIYAGDVDQNGSVDISDVSEIDNDAFNFVSGYVPSDLNGDNVSDVTDLALCDNNVFNFVGAVMP